MKLRVGPPPKFKSKPKASPVDDLPAYQDLLQLIQRNKIGENEQVGLDVFENDPELRGLKNPARTLRDNLRKFLRKHRLESDYVITCRVTDNPGQWYVGVSHEPPIQTAMNRRPASGANSIVS